MKFSVPPLLALLAGLALAAAILETGPAYDPGEARASFILPADPVFAHECGRCHTPYAPALLPARSWQQMMMQLDHHFGVSLSLDEPQRLAILRWLTEGAADVPSANPLVRGINRDIPPDRTPRYITRSGYFAFMHASVSASVWKRAANASPAQCGSCHPRADRGHYGASEVRIPGQRG